MAPKIDPWVSAFGQGPVNYVRGVFQPKVNPNAWRTDPLSQAIGSTPAAILRGLAGAVGRPAAASEYDAVRPEGSMATLGGKPVQWLDNKWVPFQTEGEMAREEQARIRREAPPALNLPPAPGHGTTPIVQASDDAYRQLLSQYGGLQKQKKYEEAEKLGQEIWQKKYGKTAMAQPGGAVGTLNPLMRHTFGSEPAPSYAGSQVQPLGSTDFAVAANAVPAPWNEQGAKVSSEFAGVVPFQAAKTTGEGMPAFQTTGEKAAEFLSKFKLGGVF